MITGGPIASSPQFGRGVAGAPAAAVGGAATGWCAPVRRYIRGGWVAVLERGLQMFRSQLHPSLRGLVLFAALVLSCGAAFAEEVRIGHLETKDDTGINWLYLRCEKPTA